MGVVAACVGLLVACGGRKASQAHGGATSSGDGSSTSGAGGGAGGGVSPTDDDGLVPPGSVWRTTSEWYRPIATAPVAEHSSEMIAALERWGQTGVFQIDFSFNVLDARGAAPVTIPPQDEGDDVPVPIPARGYVEGDHAYDACPRGDDCHVLVIDRDANRLYELYQVHKSGSSWEAYTAFWKLDKIYPRSNRGLGCTSADAAGLPIVPGLISYKETKRGAINHALRFIARNEFIRGVSGDRNTPNVVYPASHGSLAGNAARGVPYGGRLRLKSTISDADPRITSRGARAVVRALRDYGMILADGGNIPLVAESARVHQDQNPAETWDGLLGPRDLGFLRPSDFEVVAIPKDAPNGAPGWYASRVEYEGQLQRPLGCKGIVQP